MGGVSDRDDLARVAILRPFQLYFSHIRAIKE